MTTPAASEFYDVLIVHMQCLEVLIDVQVPGLIGKTLEKVIADGIRDGCVELLPRTANV